jgi:hypothetical protein
LSWDLTCNPSPAWDTDSIGDAATPELTLYPDATGFDAVTPNGGRAPAGLEGGARVVTGTVAGPTTVGLVVDTGLYVTIMAFAFGTGLAFGAAVSVLTADGPGMEADASPA